MREWSQFTDGAIGEFNRSLGNLVDFVETSLYCENAKHSLAAGHVYLNGGEVRNLKIFSLVLTQVGLPLRFRKAGGSGVVAHERLTEPRVTMK